MMNEVTLDTYSVVIGESSDILSAYLNKKSFSSIIVLVDENTKTHCLPLIEGCLDPKFQLIQIPSGEKNKNLNTCKKIWTELVKAKVDRYALFINLGGGVIGDMGGFAASVYMRGIDFIHIPTTLLSQVDASVGGKLAVDFLELKNMIGLFKNPGIVIVDPSFNQTLKEKDFKSGFAEMIKHALIWDRLEWNNYLWSESWQQVITPDSIAHSINIKKDVVQQDPYESGLRKILNFGHTLGHAIETDSFQSSKPLLHGEAIALGMIGEAYLSSSNSGLSKKDLHQITQFIKRLFENLIDYSPHNFDSILTHIDSDKKNMKGKNKFSLLQAPGQCVFNISVENEQIKKALEYVISTFRR